jgi:hypothetical protein
MSDSLVIGNGIELLGNVVSDNPLCPGARFMLQQGADPGAPQPTTDFVASLILDGERPFGRRASNRTITLPLYITAPTRLILAAAREVVQQAIDQDMWTLTYTMDPGPGGTPLPLVLDCFRAQPSKPVFNTRLEKQLQGMMITLTIPALPYGRSDTQQQAQFAAPVPASPPPPPSPVVLDSFSSISSPEFFQSSQCVVGPHSACWDPDGFGDPGGQETPLVYQNTFSAPLNLASMTSLQFYLGLGTRYYTFLEYHGRTSGVSAYITLTDQNGNQLSFSRSNLVVPVSPIFGAPVFSRISVPIPVNNPVFQYNAVTSYTLTIVNRKNFIHRFSWVTGYLDALTAYPSSQTATPVVRGNVYTLYGLLGTARAPMTLAFQQAPTPQTATTITTTGASNYTVPGGTSYLKVEAIGGGGAGASCTVTGVGGGGGGAEYAQEPVFPAVAAQVIPYNVGSGGAAGSVSGTPTFFGPGPSGTLLVQANPGFSASANSAIGGLGGTGSTNSLHFPGGTGRTASGSVGGGGGSSGGNASAGSTPTGTGSTTLTSGTSYTVPTGVTQLTLQIWGGGGGAASGSNSANGGGGGGGGFFQVTVPVTSGATYTMAIGAGGAGGGSAGGLPGSAGGTTSITIGGTTYSAFGGAGGTTSVGGNGGSGATFNGGKGGQVYPYGGGGGSSASYAGPGNTGSDPGGATAPTGGGGGGAGSGPNNVNGGAGSVPGGGGGGTYFGGTVGGAGAGGQIVVNFPSNTGAPTPTGAPAVAGGGAGGNGGASNNTAGSAGAQPGGGGGGADSAGTSETGGAGGNGKLIITPFASTAFKSLIVHRPPLGALKTFQPLVSVGAGSDVPNGGTQYTMPQPVSGVQADFGGTYTVLLIAKTWNGSSSRTITVTVTQAEYSGGATYATSTVPVVLTPSQVNNGIVTAGVLTLPLKQVAPDNTGGLYTVSVTDTNTADRFYDVIFLDTQGQTVIINEPTTGYITYYLDAPDPNVDIGPIMGSQFGRPDAISVMDNALASGGPMFLEPSEGDNQLFAYSADASAPDISMNYFPAWYFNRFQ